MGSRGEANDTSFRRFPMLRAINKALSTHSAKRPTTTTTFAPKPDIDLDVDNELDDYRYEVDDERR